MPALTFLQLRTRVRSNIGNRSDKDTIINETLNEGLEELVKRHFFRDAISQHDFDIAADDASVEISTVGIHQVLEVRLIDGTISHPFIIKSKRWVTDRWPNVSADNTGKPTLGYIEGDEVFLYPVSSGAYKLRMTSVQFPVAMAADGDVPSIKNVDPILIAYATSEVFDSMQDSESANRWEGRFEGRLLSAIRADKKGAANDRIVDPFLWSARSTVIQPWLDPFSGHTGGLNYGT